MISKCLTSLTALLLILPQAVYGIALPHLPVQRYTHTLQGSQVSSGNNTSLIADNRLNLLAAQNTAEQHSTNSSSSGSIGVGYSTSGKGAGLSLTASASRGGGHADGTDVSWTNTQVEAGNQLTLQSGQDATLKGATAKGKQVVANIGGNLNIESLQDNHNYNSKQDSKGFSLSIPIAGNNSAASINASNSHIDSTYASVQQQSGIQAGDDGSQVAVRGNTDLKGAVIAASDSGLNRSSFNTGGTLTQSDIQNRANYDAEATGFSAGVGAVPSASAGMGSDSGSAAGTTKSGVGISTKGDTTGKVDQIFDAQRVNEEINAQVQITQTFSVEARTTVANYAEKQTKPYRDASDYQALTDKREQGQALTPEEIIRLSQLQKQGVTAQSAQATLNDPQAQADYDHWKEGGSYRIALHTLASGFNGGVDGAAGGLAVAGAAPLLDDLQAKVQETLKEQGMSATQAKLVAQGLAEATSASMGAAVGGTQGAASGFTVDTNNRQLSRDERKAISKKANNDKAKEERLMRAACAEVKCWEQYQVGSPEREEKYVSVMDALSLNEEVAWIREQQAKGLFNYSTMDRFLDDFKSDKLPMISNGVKVVTGALTVDAAFTICGTTGIGCYVAAPMGLFGENNMVEGISGLRNRYDGYGNAGFNPLRSEFNQLSPTWGNTAYDGLDLLATVIAMGAPVPGKIGFSDGINRTDSMFGVTAPRFNNSTLNPLTKLPLPNGVTQATLLYSAGDKGSAVVHDIFDVVGSEK